MRNLSRIISSLSLTLAFSLSSLPLHSQTCPQPFVLRQEACPSGSSVCSTKGSSLTYQQLDRDIINTIGLCNGPGRFTWPAPSTGYLLSTSGTISHVSASGVGSCTNQLVSALNNNAAPTCSSVSAAMMASGVLGWTDDGTSVRLTTSTDTVAGSTSSGGNLTITSTSHATKGFTFLNSAQTIAVDEANVRFGIGVGAPGATLHVRVNSGSESVPVIVENQGAGAVQSRITVGSQTWGQRVDGTNYYIRDVTASKSPVSIANSAPDNSLRIDASGNVGFGATTFGTSAAKTLAIPNGTCPTTGITDGVQICVADSAAGDANLFMINEAGIVERVTGLSKRVKTQFDKTSSTVLGNVTDLTFNVGAGKAYGIDVVAFTTSNVAGGVKFAVGGTATASSIIYEGELHSAGTITQTRATALAAEVCAVTAVTAATCYIHGTIVVNAGGTLTIQMAQNASNGSASSVLVNSTFVIKPIGN